MGRDVARLTDRRKTPGSLLFKKESKRRVCMNGRCLAFRASTAKNIPRALLPGDIPSLDTFPFPHADETKTDGWSGKTALEKLLSSFLYVDTLDHPSVHRYAESLLPAHGESSRSPRT